MTKSERKAVVLSMEILARCVVDETAFYPWLTDGVADGDIPFYETLEKLHEKLDEIVDDYYVEDDATFGSLMGTFLIVMKRALKSGGLYSDGVVDDFCKKLSYFRVQ